MHSGQFGLRRSCPRPQVGEALANVDDLLPHWDTYKQLVSKLDEAVHNADCLVERSKTFSGDLSELNDLSELLKVQPFVHMFRDGASV